MPLPLDENPVGIFQLAHGPQESKDTHLGAMPQWRNGRVQMTNDDDKKLIIESMARHDVSAIRHFDMEKVVSTYMTELFIIALCSAWGRLMP